MSVQTPMPVEVRAKYTFTEDERQQLGADLGAKIDRLDGLEAEKKSAMSDWKERIDRASSEVRKIASNINLGYEYRSYTCRIQKNFKLKIKEYYDIHSGKLIDTVKFDAQDCQQTFDEISLPAPKQKALPKKSGLDINPSLSQGVSLLDLTKEKIRRAHQKSLDKEGTKILKKSGHKKNGQPKEAKQ